MPLPPFAQLITPGSNANGLSPESVQERILTIVAMLASGTGPDGTLLPSGSGGALGGVYGDTSDGTVTFDGVATILGMAPSSNTYTLTRDFFFNNATINSGVSIITNGYRLFVGGTLTNNGTIQWNGANAATLGNPGAATGNTTGTITNVATVGTAGGAGSTGAGNSPPSPATPSIGGAGGNGGASTNAAGSGATTFSPVQYSKPRFGELAMLGFMPDGSAAFHPIGGGGGGGAGGGDNTNKGGAGGSGAGVVVVSAKVFAGTGAVQARGGAGGVGVAGNAGGGGGGGGGVVIVMSTSVAAGVITGQTIDANGGAPGAGVGTGANGVAGTAGTAIVLPG